MKRLWKTTIKVEILSERPFDYDTLGELHYMITEGGYSGIHEITKTVELKGKRAINECEKQGTDPEFFFGGVEDN